MNTDAFGAPEGQMHNRNAHGHVTRAFLRVIYRKNAQDQDRDAQFVRACAHEPHMDKSQEPAQEGIYRKNAAAQSRAADFLCEPAQSKHTRD